MSMGDRGENMWVEIEVHEDDDGLTCYSGLAERNQVERVIRGAVADVPRFLRLDHVYWTRTRKETEWEAERREVMEYGKGSYGNYAGYICVRVENIILLSELKGGAELQRKYIEMK